MVHDNNNTILQYRIVHIYLVRGTTTCSNINWRMKINFINTIFFFYFINTIYFYLLYQHHLNIRYMMIKKIQYYNIIFIRSEVQKHAAIMPVG